MDLIDIDNIEENKDNIDNKDIIIEDNKDEEISFKDKLINGSRLAPTGNGTETKNTTPATNTQKWWIAILIGILAFIVYNPGFYAMTNYLSVNTGGIQINNGGPNLAGLLLHTLIFIIILRILFW